MKGRFHRLSKRSLMLSLGSLALPVLATVWLFTTAGVSPSIDPPLVASAPPDRPDAGDPAHVPSHTDGDVVAVAPQLPAELEARTLAELPVEEVEAVVTSPGRTGAARYLALRRLETAGPSRAQAVAERLATAPVATSEERMLAINALGVLHRSGERVALERCARGASDEGIRRAAQVLLAR